MKKVKARCNNNPNSSCALGNRFIVMAINGVPVIVKVTPRG